jgi:hypothetical protein
LVPIIIEVFGLDNDLAPTEPTEAARVLRERGHKAAATAVAEMSHQGLEDLLWHVSLQHKSVSIVGELG